MLILYQAEWCPFCSAVREVLTELGLDVVTRQVEPRPEERASLRARAGTDEIPTLETDDGRFFSGTRAIFALLHDHEPGEHAAAHRERFLEHRDARESDAPGHLVEYFRSSGELTASDEQADAAEVVHVPGRSRYELRVDGGLVGIAAYHRSDGRITFTHTEVDPSCEGRGFGTKLVLAALDDAHGHELEVVSLCPFVSYLARKHGR